MDDAVKNIRTVRLVVDLPAMDPIGLGRNVDGLVVTLAYIGSSTAAFDIDMPGYDWSETIADVPVLTGIDAYPTTESYVVVAEPSEPVLLSRIYRLHPDCVVLRQLPPTLTFQLRTDLSADLSSSTTSDWTFPDNGPLAFGDGHNASVSGRSGRVAWNGAPGAGLGPFEEPPFAEFDGREVVYGQGLRSINGNIGNVSVSGAGTVSMTVVRSQDDRTTTITLGSRQ